MRFKVLITEKIHESGINLLRENDVDVILLYEGRSKIEEAIKEVDGVIVRVTRLGRELLETGKKHRLKVIAKHGIGVDNIDLEAARDLGIRVVYVPEAVVNAVAEHTIGLILLMAKRFMEYDRAVRSGNWEIKYERESLELKGKVLGIIGFGRIGKAVASLARCFGMRILVYDPYAEAIEPSIKRVSLEELLENSDFVSIHCPLTRETYHLLGEEELKRMKKTAYLINTARGGIVDEEALCKLIRVGKIAGAALDTIEEEPPNPRNPILSCPNVVLTAHTAGSTSQALKTMSFLAAKQILQVLRGEKPKYALI